MTKGDELSERLLNFAARVIKLATTLPKSVLGQHVLGQIIRSATSAGANYEEACGAESNADFAHKLGIVLKELRESKYWLKLIARAELINEKRMKQILQEAEDLTKIIGKSLVTVRKRKSGSRA